MDLALLLEEDFLFLLGAGINDAKLPPGTNFAFFLEQRGDKHRGEEGFLLLATSADNDFLDDALVGDLIEESATTFFRKRVLADGESHFLGNRGSLTTTWRSWCIPCCLDCLSPLLLLCLFSFILCGFIFVIMVFIGLIVLCHVPFVDRDVATTKQL